ncbi:competence protein CoiA [Metaplanococcus flavidus]|uniref:Competence protein CoiA n=1 Tax=Metaplanococcus flavidus TaxID=569883 RepID=A0ABW3LCD0_9BACL
MTAILIAKTEGEQVIDLIKNYSRQELLELRSNSKFTCPDCGNILYLKIGNIKIPHFAHKSHSDCDSYSESESSLHLQGKILLHKFFTAKNFKVELEKYMPEIRQRADLLVDSRTVIEFQCSAISAHDVVRRTAAYKAVGLYPTWIFGNNEKPENRIQVIHLMEYQKKMLINHEHTKYLLLLNPSTGQFTYYSNLFFISGNRWVGKISSLPANKQTFPFAVPKRLGRKDFETMYSVFALARTAFIRSQLFAKNRYQNPFWLLCYKLGLDIRNVPATIGVPIAGAECIAEHAVIWQLKTVRALEQGKSVSDLISSMKIKLSNKGDAAQLEKVMQDYTSFIHYMAGQNNDCERQMEGLYDIYCKRVRKLRK